MSIETLYGLFLSMQSDDDQYVLSVIHDKQIWCITGHQINVYFKRCHLTVWVDSRGHISWYCQTQENSEIKNENKLRYIEKDIPNILLKLGECCELWDLKELHDMIRKFDYLFCIHTNSQITL